jgi:hypothetical protein
VKTCSLLAILMPPQFETVKVSQSLKTSVTVLFQSQQSFANVAVTADGVETISFLEAADGLMDLFGKNSPSIPSSPFSQPMPRLSSQLRLQISWVAPSLPLSKPTSGIT